MPSYGHARVSTTDRDHAVQRGAPSRTGCTGFTWGGSRARMRAECALDTKGAESIAIAAEVRMSRGTVWRALRAEAAV